MKKTGITLAILLTAGVALTAGAWFTGKQLETLLGDAIAEANQELERQMPGGEVRLELESLERGLFTSQARYRIELGELAADLPSSELRMVERIEHGPLPLSRLLRLRLLPVMTHSQARLEENALSAPLFRMAGDAEPLTIASTLGYDQSVTLALDVAPLRHADDERAFEFSGFSGEFTGSAEVIRGQGAFARLQLSASGEQPGGVSLHDFRLDLDRVRGESGLFLGEQSSRLGRVEVSWSGMAPLVLHGVDLRDRVSEEASLLAAEFAGQVREVTYADQPLGSVRMAWSARDLDAVALKALADLLAGYAETLDSDPEHEGLSSAQQEYLMAALLALLASEPKLNLDDLSVRTASAESRLSIAVGLRRPRDGELTPDEAIREALSSLEVRLDVPKASIRDLVGYKALFDPSLDPQEVSMEATLLAEMAGNMAVGMQLASLEDETLKARLSYADGQVTFNGTTQPLEEFLAVLGMLLADIDE